MGPIRVKADPTDHTFATEMYKVIGELIASGQLKPNPQKKYPNGLSSVEQGFQDAQGNKVSLHVEDFLIFRFVRPKRCTGYRTRSNRESLFGIMK